MSVINTLEVLEPQEPTTVAEVEVATSNEIVESITGDNDQTDPVLEVEDIPLHLQLTEGGNTHCFQTEHERTIVVDSAEPIVESQATLESYLELLTTTSVESMNATTVVVIEETIKHIRKRHGLSVGSTGLETYNLTPRSSQLQVQFSQEALKSTLDELEQLRITVSTEGIMDFFGDIFRNLKHGRKPALESLEVMSDLIKELKKTYGNTAWLAKRRIVEGEVKFKANFQVGDDLVKAISELKTKVDVTDKMLDDTFTKAIPKIKPWADYLTKKVYNSKPDEARSLAASCPRWNEDDDIDKIQNDLEIGQWETITREALTEEEIAQVVKVFIDFIEHRFDMVSIFGKAWSELFHFKYNGRVFDRFVPAPIMRKGNYSDVITDILKVKDEATFNALIKLSKGIYSFNIEGEKSYWRNGYARWLDLNSMMRVVFNWLNASVK